MVALGAPGATGAGIDKTGRALAAAIAITRSPPVRQEVFVWVVK